MDISKSYKPHTILVWNKIADNPRAKRICNLFPNAEIRTISLQRLDFNPDHTLGDSLRTGKRILMLGKTSQFINTFDGELGDKIRCCSYHKLNPLSNGCPFYCTYCYLAFVYRRYTPYIKLNVNYDTMLRQIRNLAESHSHIDLNMGEMLDSLALDHITELSPLLIPYVSQWPHVYLSMLTKSANIDNLLQLAPTPNITIAWSLNTPVMIRNFEIGTATLDQRLNAAKACQQHGYRIRLRIDPCILYEDWEQDYADLIGRTLNTVTPENITIGTLRLLPGHKKLAIQAYPHAGKKLAEQELINGSADHKGRYPIQKRLDFYEHLINVITDINPNIGISICRESDDIWTSLPNTPANLNQCTCINTPSKHRSTSPSLFDLG